jgi:hypothetical protein
MYIAAIVANVVQLIIILALFLVRGLELGALVIFLLFLLMPIPFINFLALFFCRQPIGQPAAGSDEENGMIKREAMRVRYSRERCPTLNTGGTAYAVRDLSEGGVCIRASSETPFKKKINGEILLISGERIRFKGSVRRREPGEVIFVFNEPIGTAILMEEKKAIAVDASA